jgi:poly-gamma-glutamate synthesis protein (capsule biosynthesis protein)
MTSFIFVGDLLGADRQHTLGIGVGSTFFKEKDNPPKLLYPGKNPDQSILFGNLEAPIINEINENMPRRAFSGSFCAVEWLSKNNFDIVSVANNHILEHGSAGFESTITSLKSAHLNPVGIADVETGSNVITLEKEDICVGFAAFNDVHDIVPNNSYAELNDTNINKAINSLKKQDVDIICLSFHWGNEYMHIPSWEQVQLARKTIDAGADIVIGHHPHVVQPIEEYKHGIIIYSLGNFLFDMLWSKQVRSGMTVECEVNKNGVQSYKASLADIQEDFTPVIRENDKWLNRLLDEKQALMMHLLEKGKGDYEKYYFKKLKINRFKARLGMKKQLMMQWPSLPKSVKKQIIKGIFNKVKL